MKRRWIPVLGGALLLLVLSTFQVAEGSYSVLTRFGKPVKVVEDAGLHFKLPSPIDTAVSIDMRKHLLDPGAVNYLTADKKNLLVDSFLVWSVADPLLYYRTVGSRGGAEARLGDVLRSVVGDVLSSYQFDQLIASEESGAAGLAKIATDLRDAAAARAESSMGLKIHSARIKRLNFPEQNKRSVFSRMESERRVISSGFRAQGREEYDIMKAKTDREEAELLADANRKAAEILGAAEAEAAKIYADAFSADPELYEFMKNLETLESVLGEDSLIVLPHDHPLFEALNRKPGAASDGD